MVNKSEIEKLEINLWEKMDKILGDVDENTTYLMHFYWLKTKDGKEYMEKVERDDFTLGLSGLDAEAEQRIIDRRKNVEEVTKELEDMDDRKALVLRKWKEQQSKMRGLK